MKKSTPAKLKVRRETLRALADVELGRVLGGEEALMPDTGKEVCHAATVIIPAPATK